MVCPTKKREPKQDIIKQISRTSRFDKVFYCSCCEKVSNKLGDNGSYVMRLVPIRNLLLSGLGPPSLAIGKIKTLPMGHYWD